MYKAKGNIYCGNNFYEIGKVYSTLAKGVDINDFEIIDTKTSQEVKEEMPKMTTGVLKTKKK